MSGWKGGRKNTGRRGSSITWWSGLQKPATKEVSQSPPSAETERAFTDSLGDLTSLGEEQVFVGLVRGEATCRQWSLSPQPAWWAPEHSLQLLGLLEAQVPA